MRIESENTFVPLNSQTTARASFFRRQHQRGQQWYTSCVELGTDVFTRYPVVPYCVASAGKITTCISPSYSARRCRIGYRGRQCVYHLSLHDGRPEVKIRVSNWNYVNSTEDQVLCRSEWAKNRPKVVHNQIYVKTFRFGAFPTVLGWSNEF